MPAPKQLYKIQSEDSVLNRIQDQLLAVLNPVLRKLPFVVGGDLTGDSGNQTVVGIQTNPVSDEQPQLNDVLTWDGQEWAPTPGGGGGAATVVRVGGTFSAAILTPPPFTQVAGGFPFSSSDFPGASFALELVAYVNDAATSMDVAFYDFATETQIGTTATITSVGPSSVLLPLASLSIGSTIIEVRAAITSPTGDGVVDYAGVRVS